MVAYPDRGAGNDPKPFFLGGGVVFHHQGSIFFTVGNMEVMICLGQGGLRSLSASSYCLVLAYKIPDQSPKVAKRTGSSVFTI